MDGCTMGLGWVGNETGWKGRRVWLIRNVGTDPFGVEVSLVST